MATNLSYGFQTGTDTPTDPVAVRDSIVPLQPNYSADWRVISEGPGEVVLTNIRVAGDLPETIRFAYTEIKDIFKGTNVVPSDSGYGFPSNRAGASILVQANLVGADGNGNYWPVSAHLVLKVPTMCTNGDDLVFIIDRLLGHLYETGANDPNDRLNALVKGAMQPVGL